MTTSSAATLLVTGGAGFIGSNFVLASIASGRYTVVNLDKLTYAGNTDNLASLAGNPRHHFVEGDIADRDLVARLLAEHRPRFVVNFAAESHVDRSIDGPADFIRTNIVGTFELLEACRKYLAGPGKADAADFRFLQVSTDEVYGSLPPEGAFTEETRFAPNSPYAATKASADHLVRSYFKTYGLPVLTTNCSNNYGPFQFPEKLIPLVTLNALDGKPLPIYGDGKNIRDWLHVEDHCSALQRVLDRGVPGQQYNIGGNAERTNLDVVSTICALLDELAPRQSGSYKELITFVPDRPGHDRRYAIDARKINRELGWQPAREFSSGMRATIEWYLQNRAWCDRITQGTYRRQRLGLGEAAMERK